MNKPLFITFEGVDGSGKGTQLEKIISVIKNNTNNFIGNKYTPIWISREPTKLTSSGRKISEGIIKGGISGEEASKLFITDRIEHTTQYIIPRLKEGNIVLVDRYDISTYAYQMAQGMNFDILYHMHNYAYDIFDMKNDGTIVPDITIIFHIPVDVAMDRINKRNETLEQFEVNSFQHKVKYTHELAVTKIREKQPNRKIIWVNANQSIENVTKEMVNKIQDIYKF